MSIRLVVIIMKMIYNEVINMKKKALVILSILVFSVTAFTFSTVNAVLADGFYYSGELVAGRELEWELVNFEAEGTTETGVEIFYGHTMVKGDVFKIELLEDLNSLTIAGYEALFTTTTPWANFYINDVLLTDDASEILFLGEGLGSIMDSPLGALPLIIPTTLVVGGENQSFFDDALADAAFTDTTVVTEGYTLGLSMFMQGSLFITEMSMKGEVDFLGMEMTIDSEFKLSFNMDLGILHEISIDSYSKMVIPDVTTEEMTGKLLFQSTEEVSGAGIPFYWVYGLMGLFILGLAYTMFRRK